MYLYDGALLEVFPVKFGPNMVCDLLIDTNHGVSGDCFLRSLLGKARRTHSPGFVAVAPESNVMLLELMLCFCVFCCVFCFFKSIPDTPTFGLFGGRHMQVAP